MRISNSSCCKSGNCKKQTDQAALLAPMCYLIKTAYSNGTKIYSPIWVTLHCLHIKLECTSSKDWPVCRRSFCAKYSYKHAANKMIGPFWTHSWLKKWVLHYVQRNATYISTMRSLRFSSTWNRWVRAKYVILFLYLYLVMKYTHGSSIFSKPRILALFPNSFHNLNRTWGLIGDSLFSSCLHDLLFIVLANSLYRLII